MKIAVVGATGVVGLEMVRVLAERVKPKRDYELRLFASRARPQEKVLALEESWESLGECDFVLNATGDDVARTLESRLRDGQVLIDNSSAFRMGAGYPLVVPEVNAHRLKARPPVVANPNCTAILLCVALKPLTAFGLERVVVSTYQAASGAGLKGLEELEAQQRALGRGEALPTPEVFPFHLAGNVLSHNSKVRVGEGPGQGYNEEEWKVVEESRKMLELPTLSISATCIRVPVARAHSEAVTVDVERDFSLEAIRAAWAGAPGLRIVDEPELNHFPMPIESQNQDLVFVGRLRRDISRPRTLHFFLSGDQIRKGAATNAVQILERYL